MALDVDRALRIVDGARTVRVTGRVSEITGLVVRATVPGIRHGEMVDIERAGMEPLPAEVVGFRGEEAVLLPLGEPSGVGPDSAVVPRGQPLTLRVGEALLGRVVDGLGRPIDDGPPLDGHAGDLEPWPVDRAAPDPLTRRRVDRPLPTGVRAIDGFLTLGEGQRIGLFAGSGVGKSTLMGQIARSASADVNVICLVGERGREVRDFIEDSLGPEGLARSVVVCATSDAPSLVRLKSTFVATAIAEWFRDRQGKRVLMMVDSLTRFARAQREVGLSAGEPPARQGYPPSVFAALPRLLERAGNSDRGSITAIYTVLVAGGDMEEPIADEVRGIVDGHIVLDRSIGARGRWPAIDVLHSVSRVMSHVATPEHVAAAQRARELLAAYESHRDLITLGAYKRGSDPRVDAAIAAIDAIEQFLRQGTHETEPFDEVVAGLAALAGGAA
ncbi:MAG: FliI/YscN family ATPase [Deltaproteobacteria bacterium]|nr:MAG: FliI/YscN family ATPase [Deltaproteobacteria bacterium]